MAEPVTAVYTDAGQTATLISRNQDGTVNISLNGTIHRAEAITVYRIMDDGECSHEDKTASLSLPG